MIEKMDDFFNSRVDIYNEHMLNNAEGCKEGYCRLALEVPQGANRLLDLGCGTGLELNEVFKKFPDIEVTGIDIAQAMLDKLASTHAGKYLKLINANYLDCDFGSKSFDAAISFQTLHHFSHAVKTELYKKIFKSLVAGGRYIECDYMVEEQAEEDFFFSENERIRREQGIPADALYHYDTPCTIENQMMLLTKAGFREIKMIWRKGCTTIIAGHKYND